jgi:hypothetical protein
MPSLWKRSLRITDLNCNPQHFFGEWVITLPENINETLEIIKQWDKFLHDKVKTIDQINSVEIKQKQISNGYGNEWFLSLEDGQKVSVLNYKVFIDNKYAYNRFEVMLL